jgi:hypothetical protein
MARYFCWSRTIATSRNDGEGRPHAQLCDNWRCCLSQVTRLLRTATMEPGRRRLVHVASRQGMRVMPHRVQTIVAAAATWAVMIAAVPLLAETGRPRLEGKAAFGDWSMDKPGTRRLIRPQDLPTADQAHSATNFLYHVARSERQRPSVPTGFDVKLFASGLSHQRLIRVAPNGDVFAAESEAGRIRVLRPNGGQSAAASIFADGLHGPFGIAFYPPGHDPSWVYVGNTDSVVRFAYRSGDLKARAPAESIVPRLSLRRRSPSVPGGRARATFPRHHPRQFARSRPSVSSSTQASECSLSVQSHQALPAMVVNKT